MQTKIDDTKIREIPGELPKETWTQTNKNIGNDEIKALFFPLTKNWDKDIFDFLKNMVFFIHKILKKERFENEYIEKNFAKLSARELLTEGKTFYMNPCLDFVLVTIEGLKRTGIENIKFIVEELQCPGNGFKVHFGIELIREGKNYYIDYRSMNNVFLWQGNFMSNYEYKGETIAHSIKIDAKNISVDDNIYTLMERWIIQFKNLNMEVLAMLKEKLKKHNKPEQWDRWFVSAVEDINKPEIFLENKEE